MDFIALGAAAAIMGAIITGLLALYQGGASPRFNLDRRLGHVMGEASAIEVAAAGAGVLRPKRAGHVPIIGPLLEGKEWTTETALRLEGADMRLTVSEYVGLRIFMALMFGI